MTTADAPGVVGLPDDTVPDIDIIVTHYDDEQRLGWVLDALAAQTYPVERLHVVVADDGSPRLPAVPDGVRVVTQPDEGFRAARARNLGAAQGSAAYVLFLDGDTVPAPTWCVEMVAALVEVDGAPCDAAGDPAHAPHQPESDPSVVDDHRVCGALVVGRRRHADLGGLDAAGVAEWVANSAVRQHNRLMDDPRWLLDGYERTGNLREAGADDWRLVISAVMGMTRGLFDGLGGFDESLVGYGGEDWDLAYRAWNAGAELRHAPSAIAWHDGADAASRVNFADLKEGEQLALAARIPQPSVRGRHGVWPVPRVVVSWEMSALRPSVEYAVLESWLGLGDVGVWASTPAATPAATSGHDDREAGAGSVFSSPLSADPRVHVGNVPATIAARAEIVVTLRQPCLLLDAPGLVEAVVDGPVSDGLDGLDGDVRVTVATTRQVRRRETPRELPAGIVEHLNIGDGPLDLERHGRARWA